MRIAGMTAAKRVVAKVELMTPEEHRLSNASQQQVCKRMSNIVWKADPAKAFC